MAEFFGAAFFVGCIIAILVMFGWAGWMIGTAVGKAVFEITFRK